MKQCKPAIKAVIIKDEKFLILHQQHTADYSTWGLPGGKVEYQEHPHDTLKREVKEETNLEIEIIKPLGMYTFTMTRQPNHYIVITVFLCRPLTDVIDTICNNVTDEKIIDCKWVSKKEFLKIKNIDDESLRELIQGIDSWD